MTRLRAVLRRLFPIVGVLALGLVLLEIVLQGAALVVYRANRDSEQAVASALASAPGSDQRRVLCVGDSFTFGSGASSRRMSYPSQLEQLLRERAPDRGWSVFNRGRPGRNSAQVLHRLRGWLEETRPQYLVVLMGGNNAWNRDEMDLDFDPQATSVEDEGWVWRWRTGRLIEILRGGWLEDDSTPEPFVDADGAVRGWQGRASPRDEELIHRINQRLRAARRAHDVLTDAEADALAQEVASADGPWPAIKLMRLLRDQSLYQRAADVGERALERYGPSYDLYLRMVIPVARSGDPARALVYADRAMELSPDSPVDVHLAKFKAHRLAGDRVGAFREAFSVFLAEGDEDLLVENLRKAWTAGGPGGQRRDMEKALDGLSVDPSQRSRALAILGDIGRSSREGSGAVRLTADYREIARMAREYDVHVLLLGYPMPGSPRFLRRALEAVSEEATPGGESEPTVLLLEDVFRPLLAGGAVSEYFVRDGHCNDRGYGVIAETVADAILSLEDRPPLENP